MWQPVYKAGTGYEVRRIPFQPSGVSKKDAISILVYVYFPLTLWVKRSFTVTSPGYVTAHPMLYLQKKITVSKKASKKFPGNLYHVEGIIPESTSKLSDFLYKPENRVAWDKSLKVYNMVHKIDSDTFICHTITQSFAMGSISPREFIDLVYFKRCEGNMDIIGSNSVDFPAYPPSSNYIRGYNHACGYICSPLQENPAHSKLVMFVQTEMRGKLSPSIIEATMPSNLVSFILNAKDGIKTHKTPSGCGRHHNGHSSFLRKK